MTARIYATGERWTLWHGRAEDVLPGLTAGSVDAVVTDPPYAISVAGSQHVGQPGKGVRRLDFFRGDADWQATIALCTHVLRACIPLLTEVASVYAWVGHREFGPVISLLEESGFATRFLVWAKKCVTPPPPGSGWPSGAELCVYAYRPGRTWNHDGVSPPPSNVFVSDSYRHGQSGKVDHPTQKPLAVVTPLLRASTHPGDLILDPFAGSGTTGVAALTEGRRFVGVEIEEKYAAIAARRLKQAEAQLPLPIVGDARQKAEQCKLF